MASTATSDGSSSSAATSCSEPAALLQYEEQLLTWLRRFSDELASRITEIDGRIDGLLSDATQVDAKLRVVEAKLQCTPVIRGAVHTISSPGQSHVSLAQGELSGRAGMSTAGISIAQKKQNEKQNEKQKEEQKEKQKETQKDSQKDEQGGKSGGGLSFEERVQVNYQVALQLAGASQSYYSPQLTSAAAAAAAAAAAGGAGAAAVGAASPLFPPYSSDAAMVSPFPDRPDSLAALASLYDFTTAIPTPSSPPPSSEPGDLSAGLARQQPAPGETPESSVSVTGHLSGEFPGRTGTFPGAVPFLPGSSPSPPPFPSPSLSLMEPSGWAVDNFRSLLEQALRAPGAD
ncbi:unnamed protein product [Closterium sp. Naga37s-1]|nr:unnamed protein product [Closterium sp. Naga37s-1]